MSSISSLVMQDAELRSREQSYVLATIVDTAGSTYRKAGARMIIEQSGNYIGLISGGCLEGDLLLRARKVFESGEPTIVEYDMRAEDDLVWGLGLGCNGMIRILLELVPHGTEHPVMRALAYSVDSFRTVRVASVLPGGDGDSSFTCALLSGTGEFLSAEGMPAATGQACRQLLDETPGAPGVVSTVIDGRNTDVYIEEIAGPVHLLILGGGPDVLPLAAYAGELGWQVTVLDHRAAYANPAKFPMARKVMQVNPAMALTEVETNTVSAVVLMSHHFPTDCLYLKQVVETGIPFIGLLGPRVRGEKLFEEIGANWSSWQDRLHSPVGMDIGGETPEAIALSIVAEVQSFTEDRTGQPLRERTSGLHD